MGAFYIGVTFGIFYFEYKRRDTYPRLLEGSFGPLFLNAVKKSRCVRYLCYLLGFGLTFFIVFIQYDFFHCEGCWGKIPNAFYSALSRPGFVLGLALFMQGLLVGKFEFLRWVLASEFMEVVARLCYSAYLIHIFVLTQLYVSARSPMYFQNSYVLWIYCYVIIFTFLLSIVFTLTFEVPFMTLEKLVIFRKKPRKDSVADL